MSNNIFPRNTKLWHRDVKDGQPVWACFPPDIAASANITPIKTWETQDSLIDWLAAFLNLEDPEASIRVDKDWEADDVIYNLYFPSTDNVQSTQEPDKPLPVETRIYNFICQHAPVRRMKILTDLSDLGVHVIDRTLKRLVKADQIEKVRLGVYIPIHTATIQ